jgi:hypothetical protein
MFVSASLLNIHFCAVPKKILKMTILGTHTNTYVTNAIRFFHILFAQHVSTLNLNPDPELGPLQVLLDYSLKRSML